MIPKPTWWAAVLAGAVMAAPVATSAQQAPTGASGLGAEWVAIDPVRLDAMRGGFDVGNGMVLSFGVERAVMVNGELVATMRVNIPDVARMTVQQAEQLAKFNEGVLVQVGQGNTVAPSADFSGVIIQNSLDNQDLRTVTKLDISVDTLGMFQNLNTQAAMQSAMAASTRGP